MGIIKETGCLEAKIVKVVGSSTFSDVSWISSCIGMGEVGWEGTMVSCGGDGALSVMRVMNSLASDSGSFVMLIIVLEA